MAVGLIEFPCCFQSLLRITIIPSWINQTEHPTGSDLGFELVRLLHEAFLIQQSDIVYMVQPAEILTFLRTTEMVSYIKGFLIDVIFAVIRCTCRHEAHVRHLIHMPVIRIDGYSDIFVTVLIRRMLFQIILDDLLVIRNRADFRITCFLHDAML
ncbi:hypothetical protein D3C81_1168820 [compost metagenome]